MGTHVGSANEVHGVINKLREEFAPGAYHVTGKNCNHFSDALCKVRVVGDRWDGLKRERERDVKSRSFTHPLPHPQALVGEAIPAWVNRPAKIGGIFRWGGRNKSQAPVADKPKAPTKAEKAAAAKKKDLTEEQKARLEAIKRTAFK